VRSEFEAREFKQQKARRPLTRRSLNISIDVASLTYGQEINDAIENCPEPGKIEAMLAPCQMEALQVVHDGFK
jgi:hypothetical protein